MTRYTFTLASLLLFVGCAGIERDCASTCASNTGADWIVIQYRLDGTPLNCWQLKNVPLSSERGTDGIYWLSTDGHLVHLSGHYNHVQVERSGWESAAKEMGVSLASCPGGKYLTPTVSIDAVEVSP